MVEKSFDQDDLEKLVEGGAEPVFANAPSFYVSSMRISSHSNNVSISLSKGVPVTFPSGNQPIHAAAEHLQVILDMSPATAKDMLLLLSEQVEHLEKEWGTIETDFTRRRATKK